MVCIVMISFASRFLLVVAALFLAGCGPTLVNQTPSQLEQNPSGLYRITLDVRTSDGDIRDDSFEPRIVIDGSERPMEVAKHGRNVYEYDYEMPPGQAVARYYFVVDYDVARDSTREPERERRTKQSELHELRLINRYVISMESSRGPSGSEIAVVGRGFAPGDRIQVGGVAAETRYTSPNALSFIIPSLAEGQTYTVELVGSRGNQLIGQLLVDPARIKATPGSLVLDPDERLVLQLSVNVPAPAGGLPIDVKTDVPRSIRMGDIRIPEGSRTVTARLQGGEPGSGTLFLNATGYKELRVPLTVRGDSSAEADSASATAPDPESGEGADGGDAAAEEPQEILFIEEE